MLPSAAIAAARQSGERGRAVADAAPWFDLDDEALWSLMFGPTITRAWQVWSDGFCPACREPVVMYEWLADVWRHPWKMRCPACDALFPTNDFHAFYQSGLDERGIFQPRRADRALLFNADHPDPADPLHTFGVDDSEGYVDGDRRWRFIGAYLIYGQWQKGVMDGIRRLSEAFIFTGGGAYARKAAILIDRVADLYPTFDYEKQGLTYEKTDPWGSGYVTVWHDACTETRQLAAAYDLVRAEAQRDQTLIDFLSAKAAQCGLENPKRTWDDIARNIEDRILRDALQQPRKIYNNEPGTEICQLIIHTVLGWPGNRDHVMSLLDALIEKSTAVDGVTGERGTANYTAIATQVMGWLIGVFARMEPGMLDALLKRHPALAQTWRFHIDTHCLGRYYPQVGDTGCVAGVHEHYVGLRFEQPAKFEDRLAPSAYWFLHQLHRATGDPAYAQVAYRRNGNTAHGLPHDALEPDPQGVQTAMQQTIDEHGPTIAQQSLCKAQWGLTILRSGRDAHRRAAWLYHGGEGMHHHHDGMTLGLFARGVDVMADFGYRPPHYGGWQAPQSRWYKHVLAHNTVAVDGQRFMLHTAEPNLLLLDGPAQVVRAAADVDGRYERAVVMVDIDDEAFYLVDIFHVEGGGKHERITQCQFGALSIDGASPQVSEASGHDMIRDCVVDPSSSPPWRARWHVHDRRDVIPPGENVYLDVTDLTRDAALVRQQCWVDGGVSPYNEPDPTWLSRICVRREGGAPLRSTFVSVIEAHGGSAAVRRAARLPGATAIEIEHTRGVDVVYVRDDAAPRPCQARGVTFDGAFCRLRFDADGKLQHAVTHGGDLSHQ